MPAGRCLVLNADYGLLSITPNAYVASELLRKDKVQPLELYDTPLRSERTEHVVPAVAVLKRHVKLGRRRPSFTFPSKRNICVREGFRCAYCGKPLTIGTCTKDHVLPQSRGGKDTLLNVVASCWKCNNKKDNKTPQEAGMELLVVPRELTDDEKIQVIIKTHRAHERKAWLSCLEKHGLTLF